MSSGVGDPQNFLGVLGEAPVPLYEFEQEVCRNLCLDTSWRLL